MPDQTDDPRKKTLSRRFAHVPETLEDLAFYADLGIDDAHLSRGLYLLLYRAYLTGASAHIRHILKRPEPDRLAVLRRAREQVERQLGYVQRDMENENYGRQFAVTLGDQIRHRLNRNWL